MSLPQPNSRAAHLCGGHNQWSRTPKGITSSLWVHKIRTKLPHVDPLPPHPWPPLPPRSAPRGVDDVSTGREDRGSSIAPTGLWCPDGSPPTIRAPPPSLPSRSRRDTSPAAAPVVSGYGQKAQITPRGAPARTRRSVLVVLYLASGFIRHSCTVHLLCMARRAEHGGPRCRKKRWALFLTLHSIRWGKIPRS